MVSFLTRIANCNSHGPPFLDLFLTFDASICSAMAFPPLGNSDHVVVVSIDFPSDLQRDGPFHSYSRADWDDLHDHFRGYF